MPTLHRLLGGLVLLAMTAAPASAGRGPDTPYRAEAEAGEGGFERCVLWVEKPDGLADGFATVLWFHGGGLTGGDAWAPESLKDDGYAVVPVRYRLSPDASVEQIVDDAAAATAWVLKNIEGLGGDPEKVFLAGHSAGGYLVCMVAMDPDRLEAHGASPDDLAGVAPISGHTITHFTERSARGIDGKTPVIDELAPLAHVRGDAPPLLLVTGDRERELLGRYEENAYFYRMQRVNGDDDVVLFELDGFDHGGVLGPSYALIRDFVKRRVAEIDAGR